MELTVQTFHLSQQGFAQFRKRMAISVLVIILAVLGGVLIAAPPSLQDLARTVTRESNPWSLITVESLAAILPLLMVPAVLAFFLIRTYNQQMAILKSIQIDLGENYILRRQLRVPDVRVGRNEITRLQETGEVLCVLTTKKFHALAVPRTLDHYEQVKAVLLTWAPLQQPSKPAQALNFGLALGAILGTVIILFSFIPWLVIAAAVIAIGYYGYIYWALRQQEGVDPGFRRGILFITVWLLFTTVMKMFIFFAMALEQ